MGERTKLVNNNQGLLKQMNELVMNMPENLRVDTRHMSTTGNVVAREMQAKDEEHQEQIQAIQGSFQQSQESMKEQYDYFLAKKTAELKKFVDEFSEFKRSKAAEVEQLKKFVLQLHDMHLRYEQILSNVENDVYPPTKLANGQLKSLHIPRHQRPNALPDELLKFVSRAKSEARPSSAFVKQDSEAEALRLNPTPNDSLPRLRVECMSDKELLDEVRAQTQLSSVAASLKVPPSSTGTVASEQRPAQLAEQERRLIEERVLSELAEYIRSIEGERDKYRKAVQEEVQRNKDMQVCPVTTRSTT